MFSAAGSFHWLQWDSFPVHKTWKQGSGFSELSVQQSISGTAYVQVMSEFEDTAENTLGVKNLFLFKVPR